MNRPFSAPLAVVLEGETWAWPRTGVGRFAYGLGQGLAALAATTPLELQIYAEGRFWAPEMALRRFAKRQWRDLFWHQARQLAQGLDPLAAVLRRLWVGWQAVQWHLTERSERVTVSPPQIWHAPNFVPVVWGQGRLVLTIHDLSCFETPQWHPGERVRYITEMLPKALAEAAAVTVVSEATKRSLLSLFDYPADRIIVSYPGCEAIFFSPPSSAEPILQRFGLLPGRYFLSVGTIEPRKNLTTLLRAYAGLPRSFRQRFPLVVVGIKGWLTEEIESAAGPLQAEGSVRFAGFVGDELLRILYAHATGFLYLSLYEGFGLPALEAMACGAPVVVSNSTSLPEVVGTAGVLVPPSDIESIRQTMVRLAEDEAWRAVLRQLGRKRAQGFTWLRCAQETMKAYRRALE